MPEEEGSNVDDDALVVVELPPEARLVPGVALRFSGLGTERPTLTLPNGAELRGHYEESVGELLVMQPTSERVRRRAREPAKPRARATGDTPA